jgi:hypothetical protein
VRPSGRSLVMPRVLPSAFISSAGLGRPRQEGGPPRVPRRESATHGTERDLPHLGRPFHVLGAYKARGGRGEVSRLPFQTDRTLEGTVRLPRNHVFSSISEKRHTPSERGGSETRYGTVRNIVAETGYSSSGARQSAESDGHGPKHRLSTQATNWSLRPNRRPHTPCEPLRRPNPSFIRVPTNSHELWIFPSCRSRLSHHANPTMRLISHRIPRRPHRSTVFACSGPAPDAVIESSGSPPYVLFAGLPRSSKEPVWFALAINHSPMSRVYEPSINTRWMDSKRPSRPVETTRVIGPRECPKSRYPWPGEAPCARTPAVHFLAAYIRMPSTGCVLPYAKSRRGVPTSRPPFVRPIIGKLQEVKSPFLSGVSLFHGNKEGPQRLQ